ESSTGKKANEENKGNIVGEQMGGGVLVENEGEAIKGGTFKVGIPTDSPFKGIFNVALQDDNFDWTIIGPTMYGSANAGESMELRDSGAEKFEWDEKAKTATIKLSDAFKWNDGKPVTAKDIIINYLIIGHKDYPGVRYDDDMINIVGMEEYHAGKTQDIAGVKEIDEKTVQISFKEWKPSIKWGAGIWHEPTNYEQVKDIAIKDIISSDPIRKNPKSAGPFYISNVVPGQSVEFSANEHFWGGKPKIDKVVMEVVPTSQILASLKSGKYDYIAGGAPSDTFKEISELKGYKVARQQDMAYTYLGFKLGKWDKAKGEVVVDPNAKMADVNLRKAMGYAIDNNAVGEKFYLGYRSQATSVVLPIFKDYFNTELKGYNFDQEKAKKLLDEAGYKDVDNDGIREDKNGKPFVIKFASM
ncbi:MAG: ABC transporter substrate-binding protein, partial [Finegoldia magna]|nr:ABC transporter substrate-binding protein [Finegoldia magna]